jgi:sigma-E factor negative regulatory protein RseB
MQSLLMRRRGPWRSGLISGVLLGTALAWSPAASGAGKAVATPGALDTQAVVRRIQEAAQRRSYSGTFVVNAAGVISSSRILHFADGRSQIERIEALDGQMRRVYRYNDAVHVLWPKTHDASIEQRGVMPGFPSTNLAEGHGTLDMYELHTGGPDRVAGHEAQIVTFRPRDAYRYAQRLWLENQSGLLLRADTLGPRGEVIESSAFSELQLDVVLHPQPLLQEMRRLDGYRVLRPVLQRSDLDREGWALRNPPPGFTLVRCVKRPMRATTGSVSAATPSIAPSDGGGVLQATFSDGLTLVSVFVEPFDAAVHQRDSAATWGATQALSRRLTDWWVTVVGDVPLVTLQQFSSGMERRKP